MPHCGLNHESCTNAGWKDELPSDQIHVDGLSEVAYGAVSRAHENVHARERYVSIWALDQLVSVCEEQLDDGQEVLVRSR
jgi:hypothetical protein